MCTAGGAKVNCPWYLYKSSLCSPRSTLTLTVSSVMFLSILVAAYWLRRCRNTWEGGKKKKQQLTPLNRPPGLNYVLASDRFSPSKGQIEKARFEALCAAATFGCPSKLHITMDTWYTRNPICTLVEKRKKKSTIIAAHGVSKAMLSGWGQELEGPTACELRWMGSALSFFPPRGWRFPGCFGAQARDKPI